MCPDGRRFPPPAPPWCSTMIPSVTGGFSFTCTAPRNRPGLDAVLMKSRRPRAGYIRAHALIRPGSVLSEKRCGEAMPEAREGPDGSLSIETRTGRSMKISPFSEKKSPAFSLRQDRDGRRICPVEPHQTYRLSQSCRYRRIALKNVVSLYQESRYLSTGRGYAEWVNFPVPSPKKVCIFPSVFSGRPDPERLRISLRRRSGSDAVTADLPCRWRYPLRTPRSVRDRPKASVRSFLPFSSGSSFS